MAQRRMFSTDITNSDAFLDMSPSTQALYFHLAMRADDDGFVNPKMVMRLIGSTTDELKVLLGKRFLLPFESGVVVIKHWLIHNLIRADLYKETLYKKEKSTLGLNENGAYTELRHGVHQIAPFDPPKWLKIRRKELRPADGTQTVPRIGKDRLGQDKKMIIGDDQNGFNRFWAAYPRKVAKKKAEQIWNRIKNPPVEAILKHLEVVKKTEQWVKDGGQFIPHPTTFLNQERWNDEILRKPEEVAREVQEAKINRTRDCKICGGRGAVETANNSMAMCECTMDGEPMLVPSS